jgi:hypothetical protein
VKKTEIHHLFLATNMIMLPRQLAVKQPTRKTSFMAADVLQHPI